MVPHRQKKWALNKRPCDNKQRRKCTGSSYCVYKLCTSLIFWGILLLEAYPIELEVIQFSIQKCFFFIVHYKIFNLRTDEIKHFWIWIKSACLLSHPYFPFSSNTNQCLINLQGCVWNQRRNKVQGFYFLINLLMTSYK